MLDVNAHGESARLCPCPICIRQHDMERHLACPSERSLWRPLTPEIDFNTNAVVVLGGQDAGVELVDVQDHAERRVPSVRASTNGTRMYRVPFSKKKVTIRWFWRVNHEFKAAYTLLFGAALYLTILSARAGTVQELRIGYEHIGVEINGDVAKTIVTQVLINGLEHDVEAVFRYRIPADATVTEFGEWRDGRFVAALVQGKKEAEANYARAAERNVRASLATSAGENLFEMSLFGVPSKGLRRVRLKYVQTLDGLGGERHFILPKDQKNTMAASASDVSVQIHE